MPKSVLTSEMEIFIRKNYLKISGTQIAKELGIGKGIVYRFLQKENLKVPKKLKDKWRADSTRKPITEKEIQFIHDHIQDESIKTMAAKMKRTSKLIGETAHTLGYSKLIQQRALESRLKKGHVPPNKGRKQKDYMSPEMIERTKKTRFRKGHKPHNTKRDGEITIRHDHPNRPGGKPYKYLRISEGNWEPLHRHIWEKHHGRIPPGMNVIFKDGDTMNCTIDNLQMIDNSENMLRNTIHNYPEDLKKNMRLIGKLKRKIKNHEQHN